MTSFRLIQGESTKSEDPDIGPMVQACFDLWCKQLEVLWQASYLPLHWIGLPLSHQATPSRPMLYLVTKAEQVRSTRTRRISCDDRDER